MTKWQPPLTLPLVGIVAKLRFGWCFVIEGAFEAWILDFFAPVAARPLAVAAIQASLRARFML
jgi:hypothetical protein